MDREGRDSKKIDTKALLLDFECFKNFVNENFVKNLQTSISKFKECLHNNSGGNNKHFLKKLFDF